MFIDFYENMNICHALWQDFAANSYIELRALQVRPARLPKTRQVTGSW